jgi:hypothetical protein
MYDLKVTPLASTNEAEACREPCSGSQHVCGTGFLIR